MSRHIDNAIRKCFDTVGMKLDPSSHTTINQWLQSHLADPTDAPALKTYCINIAKQCKQQCSNTSGRKVDIDIVQSVLTDIEREIRHSVNNENDSMADNMQMSLSTKHVSKQQQRKLDNISIISSFSTPRFRYDMINKAFVPYTGINSSISAKPSERVDMMRDRYTVHWQRLQRNELFAAPVTTLSSHSHTSYHQIIDITSLLSRGAYGGKHIIFGMLSSGQSDTDYVIEDLNAKVHIDLRDTSIASGFYTHHCFVLAEGELVDNDVFHVTSIGHPPAEHRSISLAAHPLLDIFGSNHAEQLRGSEIELEKQQQVKELTSTAHENDMVVMLSDVHIDQPAVMDKLKVLLDGLSGAQPAVFVFMGNFTSRPLGRSHSDLQQLKYYFDQLADLITSYTALAKQSHFVFINGPNDPTVGNILPSSGLPPFLTQRLRDKLTNIHICSNPCRLMYYGREIVLYRDDLLQKMRRHCILQPAIDNSDHTDATSHLVKTIVEQSHLSPFPLTVKPIYWMYDHAVRLYPLPDVLVLADCVDQYEHNHNCLALNPGQFSTDFSFVVYMPHSNKPEFSRIT